MIHARPPVHLLFVCTANQCRSPMAAALARHELTRRTVPGFVHSAGFLEGGSPATPGAVRAMRERGLDISTHVSVRLDPELLDTADVVITMEGSHVLDLSSIDPRGAQRAIPLLAASEQIDDLPKQPYGPAELRAWVEASRRDLNHILDPGHDVEDPTGRTMRRFRHTSELIAKSIGLLLDGWFGRCVE